MAKQSKHDLDAFLTTLESKMRGPYSSLDLARIISTPSLRGALSSEEYLQNITKVLARTDKMTQLRTLVGLLGLEPDKASDEQVYKILTHAQESPPYEEWVRIIAGLARGILFVDDNGEGSRESCRGEESSELLAKTCQEIVSATRELEKKTENEKQTADMYPLFVSYRYFLLGPQLLDKVIPEHKENPHFQFNAEASILAMDDKMEKAWAEQSHEFQTKSSKTATSPTAQSGAATAAAAKPNAPGTNKATIATKPAAKARPKTNMFMPSRRGGMGGRGGTRKIPVKGTLHTRKAGAAQNLLGGKQRARMGGMGAVRSGANASSVGGRAQRLANNKSKMKMIDVTEVQGLNKQHTKRDKVFQKEATREQKLLARKRKIMEAAAEKGLVVQEKVQKLDEEAREARQQTETGGFLAALTAGGHGDDDDDDDDDDEDDDDLPVDNFGGGASPDEDDDDDDAPGSSNNEEWQEILKERSNKLSDEDRSRIEQFFTEQYNPTPGQTLYKMKLHEERTEDPLTGQQMKETYYLELDYSTFTSKQSKKTKRY